VGAAVACSGVVAAGCGDGKRDSGKPPPAIPMCKLGRTGLRLPILGYGGAALPSAWGNTLSIEARVELVRYAYDQGIRYFDTAGNYMESQPIIGEALKDRRKQVCLVTKVECTDPGEVRRSVERSLKELQTDHLDILVMHGTPGIEQMSVRQAMKVHDEMVRLRDEKVTRFIGMSAHGYFDKALALIDTGGFDQCMLSYGYVPRGYDQIWSERMTRLRDACIAKAEQKGMGIVAMKVIGAGMLGAWSQAVVPGYDPQRLAKLPAAAIRWALQDRRIDLLNIGMRLKEEVDANIQTITGKHAYTDDDRRLLSDFAERLYRSDAVKAMRIED
jgi:predicted aldo/keto reductase-like oxidoreductase